MTGRSHKGGRLGKLVTTGVFIGDSGTFLYRYFPSIRVYGNKKRSLIIPLLPLFLNPFIVFHFFPNLSKPITSTVLSCLVFDHLTSIISLDLIL